MSRNFKKLFVLGIVILLFPICVNAETFKDGNKTYILEKLNLSCAGERDYFDMDTYGNYIFLEYEHGIGYKYLKVSNDNKCSDMTNQEILDVLNNYTYDYYYLDIDTKEIYRETRFEEFQGYRKIIADEYEPNGIYYTYNSEFEDFDEVTSNDINNVSSYYKLTFFGPAKSAVLDTNISYYEDKGGIFEKINITDDNKEDIENNIINYYVEQNEKGTVSVVGKISDETAQVLSNPSFQKVDVIGTSDPNVFYFLILNKFDPHAIYSIYDQNGQLMFDNVKHFSYLDIGIFSIGRETKVELYNTDKELIYSTDKLISLHELKYYNNISFLDGGTGTGFSYYNLRIGTSNNTEPNPPTADNVVISIILGSLSLIILGSTIVSLKKREL